ncbi:MAG TPA: flippase-like domain-containing protein [Acidimicrobiales bacterium]
MHKEEQTEELAHEATHGATREPTQEATPDADCGSTRPVAHELAGKPPKDQQPSTSEKPEDGPLQAAGPAQDGAPSPPAQPPEVQAQPEPAPQPRVKRRFLPRNVKIALMVLFLFFVGEYILLPELASARREAHQLSHLNVVWLILGALLEVAALVAYTQLTHTVLSPGAPDRWRIFRINMWALAISHTLPGGQVPGTAASYKLLTEANVSGSTAATGLATQGIGSAVVLNVIFWLALLISIPLQGYNPLYGFAALLGVLLLAVFAGVIFFLTRGEKHAAVLLKKVADRLPFVRAETVTSLVQKVADRMKILFTSSDLLMKAGGWAAANWLLDCASLWVFLLAFGAHVDPIDTLVAYGLANILAVIPITPSGLGVVEITVIAILKTFGVPGDIAAAGVLSWRLVNFWLPIPFGGASYLSLRFGHPGTATAKAIPT